MVKFGKTIVYIGLCLATAGGISSAALAQNTTPAPQSAPESKMYPNATHLGFVVPDIDKAISETLTRFGLDKTKVVVRTSFKVSGGIYNGKKVDFSTQVSLIELGNMQIEFFQPTSGSSPYADQLKQHPEGSLHHVAFAVPSIADQLIKERALIPSLRIVLDAKIGSNGRYLYVDGVLPGLLVEYIQTST